MANYEECTDEELIIRLHDGEDAVIDVLMEKYKDLVKNTAGTMFILGADRDDLIQEGMIGLLKAIRDYDLGRDASFFTFAKLCISRQMYSAVRSSNRKKNAPLNAYISLYADDKDDDIEIIDRLEADELSNPEKRIIGEEEAQNLQEIIKETLSGFEESVLDLYMTGMATSEIAKVLNRDAKSTDNALQRGKAKLRNRLGK